MLPVDPSFSTCHNCSVMCCQHQSLEQHVLRERARDAHKRAIEEARKIKELKDKSAADDKDDSYQRMEG